MVFAGDESQTVRPTDFKWAALKNLITSVLGELAVMDDVGLEQNLRSPAQIAQFVEATRSQYALFEKGDRPAGITYTEVNESLSGRLVYCSLKDEKEWSELTGIFAKLSRARMVYPGFTAPNELLEKSSENSSIVTSSEVFGRTMADQYRVAASRASEKLILLDRDGEDHYEEIVRLCDDRKGLSVELERVDVGQLTHVLEENLDQESLIRSLIEDVKRIIDNQPEQAILRVRSIQKQFDSFEKLNTVPDDLRFEVARLRGVSALVGVLRGVEIPSASIEQLLAEARNALNQVKLGTAYESVQELAAAKESWSAEAYLKMLVNGVENLDQIERELPEVRRWHTGKLVTWLDQLHKYDCPAEEARAKNVLATATKMIEKLSKEYGHLSGLDQVVSKRWIDALVNQRKWSFALSLLTTLESRDYTQEGDCYSALLRHKEAAEAYELAGEPAKALQSARSIPDIDLSIRIAKDSGLPELSTLSWLKGLDASIAEHSVANLVELTKAEKDQLSKAMKSILK
jgi:tetratricopeptide (TPR) repeat protein